LKFKDQNYIIDIKIELRVSMVNLSKEVLALVPKECEICNSIRIEYWDETEDEFIFRCIDCGTYYPIPIDPSRLPIDFPF